ncbi:hypothetical protein [Hyphomicrobium sp. GJ21]|uniref:hypothetical protein n=1 Tax=Hyphomicrobium sp. GJ21 TaxID=113574 RepID=UPI000A64AD2E|nr:hypothetical protein [Hyphomicrobium sp. GJ21]
MAVVTRMLTHEEMDAALADLEAVGVSEDEEEVAEALERLQDFSYCWSTVDVARCGEYAPHVLEELIAFMSTYRLGQVKRELNQVEQELVEATRMIAERRDPGTVIDAAGKFTSRDKN